MVCATVDCEDLRVVEMREHKGVVDSSHLVWPLFVVQSVAVGCVLVDRSFIKDLIQYVSSVRRDNIYLAIRVNTEHCVIHSLVKMSVAYHSIGKPIKESLDNGSIWEECLKIVAIKGSLRSFREFFLLCLFNAAWSTLVHNNWCISVFLNSDGWFVCTGKH